MIYDERPEAVECDTEGPVIVSSFGRSRAERLRTADELESLAAGRRANGVVSGRAIIELPHDVGPGDHRQILEAVKLEVFDGHPAGAIPVSMVAQIPPVAEKQAALRRAQESGASGPDHRRVAGDPRNYHAHVVWSPVSWDGAYLGCVTGPEFTQSLKAAVAAATNRVLEERGIARRVEVEGGRKGTAHLGVKGTLAQRLPPRPGLDDPPATALRVPRANLAIERGAAHQATWSNDVRPLSTEQRAVRRRNYCRDREAARLRHKSEWLERTVKAVPAERANYLEGARQRAYRAIEQQRERADAMQAELLAFRQMPRPKPPTDKQLATLLEDARRRNLDLDELAPGWRADAGAAFAALRAFDRGRATERAHAAAPQRIAVDPGGPLSAEPKPGPGYGARDALLPATGAPMQPRPKPSDHEHVRDGIAELERTVRTLQQRRNLTRDRGGR